MTFLLRRNRPRLPGGSPLTRAVGYGLVAVAVGVFFFTNRSAVPAFDFTEETFAGAWNEAATSLGRADLIVGELQLTGEDVLGYAWSEDLLVLARIDPRAEPPRPILELAAVGSPDDDGVANVLDVLELVVGVTRPALDGAARRDILARLSLTAENRPASINGVVRSGPVEFRSTSDSEGEIGIGAVPLPADR